MDIIIIILLAVPLGLIPACIAKEKGYENFWGWWFYGWMLFIVALIHSLCLHDKKKDAQSIKEAIENSINQPTIPTETQSQPSSISNKSIAQNPQKTENAIVRVLNRYL